MRIGKEAGLGQRNMPVAGQHGDDDIALHQRIGQRVQIED